MRESSTRQPAAKRNPRTKLLRTTKKVHPLQLIVLFGLFALVGLTSGAALALVLSITPLKHRTSPHLPNSAESLGNLPASLEHPINILILGIDNSGHPHRENFTPSEGLAGNSDTMLLVRLIPATHQINVLSIPRDTLVQLPGYGTDKINDANVRGGVQLAAQTVGQMLGGVQVDRYLRLDTEGFIHLVDGLGGVEVNIPKQMDYVDKTQHLSIHFSAGKQRLNGQHLQEYVRFRHDEWGDIGRVQRQQDALKAIFREFLQPQTLSKLPHLMQIAQTNIDTDLSVGEMLAILGFMVGSDLHHTNFVMLPGRFSRPNEYPLSYWLHDPVATTAILARFFTDSSSPSVAEVAHSEISPQTRIAVATSQADQGEQVVAYLQQLGFKDVYLTDHEIDFSTSSSGETQILAQQGNPEIAEQVRRAIGVGQVQVASTGDLFSDVTLIVGSDLLNRIGTKHIVTTRTHTD